MTPLGRIGRASAAFLGSSFARAALGFALSLVIGRGLGAQRFGQWVLCASWASLLTVAADLGFGVLLTRDGARANAPAAQLVGGALLARLALVAPLGVMLFATAGWIAADASTIAGLRAAALLAMVSAAYGCFSAILISQPRWLPVVLGLETSWLAVQVAASWWMTAGVGRAGGAGEAVVALMMLATCVQLGQIATALVLWRPVFGQRTARAGPPEPILLLVRRALPFAGAGIVANLDVRAAPLLLGALSTPAAVGLFAAASKFGRLAALAPQAVFGGALPVLSGELERDRASTSRVLHTLDAALLGFGALAAAAYVALAPVLLRLAFGASFAAAAPALMWIGVGLIPALSNSGRKIALYAAGRESTVVRWSAVALAVQVAAAVILIPLLGATGAAVAACAGEAVVWLPLRRANVTAADAAVSLNGTVVSARLS